HVNVFHGLLVHARDGEPMYLNNHGTKKGPILILANASGRSGRQARTYTFPYLVFEEALLSLLPEVGPAEFPGVQKGQPNKVEVRRARLKSIRADMAALQADLKAKYSKALAAVLREKEGEEEQVAGDLQKALAEEVRPAARSWEQFPGLAKMVKDGGDPVR